MNNDTLSKLSIPAGKKSARKAGPTVVMVGVALVFLVGGILFFSTRSSERKPEPAPAGSAAALAAAATNAVAAPVKSGDVVLTVSGYVIPRERIEISPRFQGTVKWIGVKKGDDVKQGDVLVPLEDEEYQARVKESSGRLAVAEANLGNARLNATRQGDLFAKKVANEQERDEAQRALRAAEAEWMAAQGALELAQTYLNWCTIRAPITGTILEKLVNPNELVTPQSYGSGSGPSTAFLAMADLTDLQVEIDLNEADTPKVKLGQKCRVSPEAYPDKAYTGRVAEIAPEANRAKGTLQIKVQVEQPDQFLTPELTAKVDFLAD